jgi:thymidylate synthase ThyX
MTTISAQSVLASKHAITGDRIDTLLLRYPRCIHSEFMTHRMFSRNAASSRAIPVEKLIQDVLDDPFVPLHWGKNQKGMQANEECNEEVRVDDRPGYEPLPRQLAWLLARDQAVEVARAFAEAGYHKQIVNRLLEPWMHITVVCTSTNWSNFLALRDHPDAEPHIQMLAREVRKALEGAEVRLLAPGEWHLPFVIDEDRGRAWKHTYQSGVPPEGRKSEEVRQSLIKLSVARCASTSYRTVDGFDMTLERAIELHDKLLNSNPMHASPFEHQVQADEVLGDEGWGCYVHPEQHGNFTGFRQYRKMLPGECR